MTWLQPETQNTVHLTVPMPVMPTLLPRDYVALSNASNSPAKPMVKGAMLAMPTFKAARGWETSGFCIYIRELPSHR
jgi:hypothetical protein